MTPVQQEILEHLAHIDETLTRLERGMSESLVIANRICWELHYRMPEVSALSSGHHSAIGLPH